MKNKPLLIWDFDGVMANSTPFVFAYWEQAMKRNGIDFKFQDYQNTFTHKFPFEYLTENYPQVAPKIKKEYSLYEHQYYADLVPPFPNFIRAFLNCANNFEHHIISSNLKSVILLWLKKYDLQEHFKTVVGRETEGYKDEKISILLSVLNRTKNEALFIGDTISDVKHAQSAGINHIAVSWGVHSRLQLETVQPQRICDTIETLFSYLKNELRN